MPGSVTVQLQPGRHAVWNDYRTSFESTAYELPPGLPDTVKLVVKDSAGTVLPIRVAPMHEIKSQGTDRTAFRMFEAARPGAHEITVSGDFPKRVFSVAPYSFWRSLGAVFGAVLAVLLGFAAGFAIWTWTYFRRDAAAEAAGSPRPALAAPDDASLRRLTAVVYALQLAGYFTLVSPIGGVLINYLKQGEVAGTWLESHFRWQLRTFWITLAGIAAGFATLVVFVGFFILGVTLMWFLYRGIKGWIELSEGKPMYGP